MREHCRWKKQDEQLKNDQKINKNIKKKTNYQNNGIVSFLETISFFNKNYFLYKYNCIV